MGEAVVGTKVGAIVGTRVGVESGACDSEEVGSGTEVTPRAVGIGLGVGLDTVPELQATTNNPTKAALTAIVFMN